jgi:hypothetical protein
MLSVGARSVINAEPELRVIPYFGEHQEMLKAATFVGSGHIWPASSAGIRVDIDRPAAVLDFIDRT